MASTYCHRQLIKLLATQGNQMDRFYARKSREIATAIKRYSSKGGANVWKGNTAIEREIDKIMEGIDSDLKALILANGTKGQNLAHGCTDKMLDKYLQGVEVPGEVKAGFYARNQSALSGFLLARANGIGQSDRVWKPGEQTKEQLEFFLSEGLADGRPAREIAVDVQKYLKEPNRRFRRVRDENGVLQLSNPAKDYHPGQGVYRSSYKNALRLTRNEINIAYREADHQRRQALDFVVGFRVNLSNAHPAPDLCNDMAGVYPKSFRFVGWHTQCYSDDTEVMTNNGWKLFKDVEGKDKIFSLNPESKEVEYVRWSKFIAREHEGEMIRFHNRSLDMLVTPDHPMKYMDKNGSGVIREKEAKDFKSTIGGLYRGGNYQGEHRHELFTGAHRIDFGLFCEFMGYYLSDGSISWTRKNQFFIAQSKEKSPLQYSKIKDCLNSMPIKYSEVKNGFYLRDEVFYHYLKSFGKSDDKYVPEVIKTSSSAQISIFLNAFIMCDGHTRPGKEFIGNRGGKFTPKYKEKTYFTSSDQMALDIGELLIKTGSRPSFYLQKVKGIEQKHRNGVYVGNADLWSIRECRSKTATVFKKEVVNYSGLVYDLELEKNHIMYVRRNGKCVWGSNCLCFTTNVLLKQEDFIRGVNKGSYDKRFQIRSVPPGAKSFLEANADKLKAMKSKPYFIEDNFKNTADGFDLKAHVIK